MNGCLSVLFWGWDLIVSMQEWLKAEVASLSLRQICPEPGLQAPGTVALFSG